MDVIASLEVAIDRAAEAEVVAHAARVLAIDGTDDAAATGAAAGVGVTLLVTEDEARGIAFAAANGVVMLALAPPEDACCSSTGS